MKRAMQTPESMDFLLDAMCNVFGAILLVAILVAGISGVSILKESVGAQKKYDPSELHRMLQLKTAERRALQNEINMLQSLLTQGEAATMQNDKMLARAASDCRNSVAEANLLAEKLTSLHEKIARMQERKAALEQFQKQSSEQRRKSLAALKNELAQCDNALQQTPPEPFVPQPPRPVGNLQPWRLLVTADSVYEIGSNAMIRAGLPGNSKLALKHFRLNQVDYWRIRKEPGQGTPWKLWSVKKHMADASEATFFAEVLVEPDAITVAAAVIAQLRQAGYWISWHTVDQDGVLVTARAGGSYEAAN